MVFLEVDMAEAATLATPARPVRAPSAEALSRWTGIALLVLLALVPLLAAWLEQPFYLTLFSRVMIFALAATALNFVLGYGGMVSFGHSAYLGVGAYAVGLLAFHGIDNGLVQLAAGLGVALLLAGVIGALSLRTSGLGFIMITLAFAQMLLFFCTGLRQYGGDDGMSLAARSRLPGLDLEQGTTFYYLVWAVLLVTLYAMSRWVSSRFGMVLRGSKSNERRMIALGFPTFQYRWAAYVISALLCTVAGFLLANLSRYVSPAYIQWAVSGELIVMVVLGGMGSLVGPLVGALVVVVFEEFVSHAELGLPGQGDALLRDHWLGALGLFVLLVALYLRRGLYGTLIHRGGDAGEGAHR
jgi:branched-chain amino acid transport system permease protein